MKWSYAERKFGELGDGVKRRLFRMAWSYVERQCDDLARFFRRRWKNGLPTEFKVLVGDIHAALKWVLYHGRTVK